MANFVITPDFAQQFSDFVYKTVGYHSIVCDTTGTIIGDSARTRIGVVHAGSKKINTTTGMKEIAVSAEEALSNPNVKEGISFAIMVDGEKIGTYGIAGNLAIIRPLVQMGTAIMASRIKENQQKMVVENVVAAVSDNVQQAVATAQNVSLAATEQMTATEKVVAMSQHMSVKLQDTSQILDMSRSIALQTKLLGLNASIEAVRAGTHGRSFAVLAGEMQKLAQSSADATTKINKILTEVQDAIKEVIECIERLARLSSEQRQAMHDSIRLINDVQKSTLDLVNVFH